MPRAQVRLSDAIDEFLASRRANGYAKNTVASAKNFLGKFLLHTGNITVDTIEARHVDGLFAKHADGWKSPETLNLVRSHLGTFFAWCRAHRYMPPGSDPLIDSRRRHVPRKDRLRVPVGEFQRLLDSADSPRNRAIIALGLYLFLRAGEVRALKVGDVHLDLGEIAVRVEKKGGDIDRMPISRQLDMELRRWLTHYSERVGVLSPDMYLIPGLQSVAGYYDYETRRLQGRPNAEAAFRPMVPVSTPQRVVQRTLDKLGYGTHQEGCHTLRRSGARALFDELAEDGGDMSAIEVVSAMLHHEQLSTTQRYLGLTNSERKRDTRIKGRDMFVVDAPIPLRREA